jgi:hypothetical protein
MIELLDGIWLDTVDVVASNWATAEDMDHSKFQLFVFEI